MPIYEYRCQDCGHELEKLQKLSDDPLTDCPACHQSALVKKISAAGFRLKGGGWYETDFKKDGKRNLAGDAAGKESASSEKGSESSSSGESKGAGNKGGADSSGNSKDKPSSSGKSTPSSSNSTKSAT